MQAYQDLTKNNMRFLEIRKLEEAKISWIFLLTWQIPSSPKIVLHGSSGISSIASSTGLRFLPEGQFGLQCPQSPVPLMWICVTGSTLEKKIIYLYVEKLFQQKTDTKSFSMTSLLTHNVKHSTRHSFRPKTNNHPINKFFSFAVSWVKHGLLY